ncbi:hypothetical protein F4778DRAFT_762472 [Xylariomycetidae sp. FL2044]|nr:hypothetical protein F4778DRAFT_762472 [Xylariomycetidae sp. FL2044]
MKLLIPLVSIALLQGTGFAAPTDEIEPPYRRELSEASLSEVEARQADWCHYVNTGINIIDKVPAQYQGKFIAWGAAGGLGGHMAYNVCQAVGWNNCTSGAWAIADAIWTAGLGVTTWHTMSLSGTQTRVGTKRDLALISAFEEALASRGVDFELVTARTVASRQEGQSDSVSLQVLGVRDAEGAVLVDHELSLSERNAVSRLSFAARSADGSHKTKRVMGPLFKISHDFHKIDTSKQPNADAVRTVAKSIGKAWGKKMDEDRNVADYIANADFGQYHSMSMVIVPVMGEYKDSFDNPEVCGAIWQGNN